jgi:hypothetical protein
MAPIGGPSDFEAAALARRKALVGASGPAALVKNLKVFGIACFACLGGLLYGYNQGVFSGVLTMTAFKGRELTPSLPPRPGAKRKQTWVTTSKTKKNWSGTRPSKAGSYRSSNWVLGSVPCTLVSSPRFYLESTPSWLTSPSSSLESLFSVLPSLEQDITPFSAAGS